jgi:hypothetical protein
LSHVDGSLRQSKPRLARHARHETTSRLGHFGCFFSFGQRRRGTPMPASTLVRVPDIAERRAASRSSRSRSRQIIRIDQVLDIGLELTTTKSSIHQLHSIIRHTIAMKSTITTTIKRNVSSLKCTPAAVRYASCKPSFRTVCHDRPCQLISMRIFMIAFSKFDWEVGESLLS